MSTPAPQFEHASNIGEISQKAQNVPAAGTAEPGSKHFTRRQVDLIFSCLNECSKAAQAQGNEKRSAEIDALLDLIEADEAGQ